MEGNPSQFEVIGSRLGFRVAEENPARLSLVWRGARFPAYLCLGIAIALLFLSIPILEAIRQRGFAGPAGSLWYFPVMNLILLGISIFLLSLERIISLNDEDRRVVLSKRNIFRSVKVAVPYDEVISLQLGTDQVYSGFAVAGSSAAMRYPVPSLRLILKCGATVLVDRGGKGRLQALGQRLSQHLGKPLQSEASTLY
jgi:hypothetical protein